MENIGLIMGEVLATINPDHKKTDWIRQKGDFAVYIINELRNYYRQDDDGRPEQLKKSITGEGIPDIQEVNDLVVTVFVSDDTKPQKMIIREKEKSNQIEIGPDGTEFLINSYYQDHSNDKLPVDTSNQA